MQEGINHITLSQQLCQAATKPTTTDTLTKSQNTWQATSTPRVTLVGEGRERGERGEREGRERGERGEREGRERGERGEREARERRERGEREGREREGREKGESGEREARERGGSVSSCTLPSLRNILTSDRPRLALSLCTTLRMKRAESVIGWGSE